MFTRLAGVSVFATLSACLPPPTTPDPIEVTDIAMRTRQVGPKCDHNRILVIAQVPEIAGTGLRVLHVVPVPE